MAVPGRLVLENSMVEIHGSVKIDMPPKQSESLTVANVTGLCCGQTVSKGNKLATVSDEICKRSSSTAIQRQNDEYVLLKNTAVNRGMTHVSCCNVPCCYFIGIAFGWLLLGMFQYFVCVVVLGESFLDPWYFTCAWMVEIICIFNITMIIWIIECSHKCVELLDYYDKITWIGFTFLIVQMLAVTLLLLPISSLFKLLLGDFSRGTTFFVYWMTVAFPHIMILCFATFGGCSKMFKSFSRHLRHADSWNDREPVNIRTVNFKMINQHNVSDAAKNNHNNIELCGFNCCPKNSCDNKRV